MLALRKRRDCLRLVAVFVAGTFLSACMTWRTESLRPERFQRADSTEVLRLTLTSGDTIMVRGPAIANDSLVGLRLRPGTSPDSLERVAVPVSAINQAELQRSDPEGTILLRLGLAVGAMLAIAAAHPCWGWCPSH